MTARLVSIDKLSAEERAALAPASRAVRSSAEQRREFAALKQGLRNGRSAAR
jgi:hypothetical protein